MDSITLAPRKFATNVSALPSKSEIIRAVFIALGVKGETAISPVTYSDDVNDALNFAKYVGAKIEKCRDGVTVSLSAYNTNPEIPLLLTGSATVFRFSLAFMAAKGISGEIICGKVLAKRQSYELISLLNGHGAKITKTGHSYFIKGKIQSGKYFLSGNDSSQTASALLIALASEKDSSEIAFNSSPVSKPYIALTVAMLKTVGVTISTVDGNYELSKTNSITKRDFSIGGDYSYAAYVFAVAPHLDGKVTVSELDADSFQGDRIFLELLESIGCQVLSFDGLVTIFPSKPKPFKFDLKAYPHLIGPLILLASKIDGVSEITSLHRLKNKESNRIKSFYKLAENLGIAIKKRGDSFFVYGNKPYNKAVICGDLDHRIILAAAFSSFLSDEAVTIEGFEAVNKSYPNFFDDLMRFSEEK